MKFYLELILHGLITLATLVAPASAQWRPIIRPVAYHSEQDAYAQNLEAARLASVVVSVRKARSGGQGSGTFIAPTVVLTAKHVVSDAGEVSVRRADWSSPAQVLVVSKDYDLALVKTTKAFPHPPATLFPTGHGLVVPSDVTAIGYPSGSELVQRGKVVMDRWQGPNGSRYLGADFSTSFRNSPGASGGGAFYLKTGVYLGGVISTTQTFVDTVAVQEFVANAREGGFLASVAPPEATKPPEPTPSPSATSRPSVAVYSLAACAPCQSLKRHLRSRGVKYVEYDVGKDMEAWKRLKSLGYQSVPLVVFPLPDGGQEVVHGYPSTKIEVCLSRWFAWPPRRVPPPRPPGAGGGSGGEALHGHPELKQAIEQLAALVTEGQKSVNVMVASIEDNSVRIANLESSQGVPPELLAKLEELEQRINSMPAPSEEVDLSPIIASLERIYSDYYEPNNGSDEDNGADGIRPRRIIKNFLDQDGNPTTIRNPNHPKYGGRNFASFSVAKPLNEWKYIIDKDKAE